MAFLVAIVVWSLTIVSVMLLKQGLDARPEAISVAAHSIDSQFLITLVVTGILFVIAQGLLGLFVMQYHSRRPGKATYQHGNTRIEAAGAILCGIIFMTLAVMGQKVWARLHLGDVKASVLVEITGEQFAWNVRYAGADGTFGRTLPRLYDAARNPVGLDPEDAAGNDDLVLLNQLVVPVSEAVELRLLAKDVLHSFYIPVLRIKQDAVPGIQTRLRFAADKPGTYEIACAELCGLGHYRMQGKLTVMAAADYQNWLLEQASAD
jgi:cytochrome c oxidase subunit 2